MKEPARHVIMVASENDALKNGKVGGVGDVVRDLPTALAELGWSTTVIVPSYGFLHKDNPSSLRTRVQFPFAGTTMEGELWEVTAKHPNPKVTQLVFEHPGLRGTPIYFNDPPQHAFAQDATKYALLCSAVGQYVATLREPFVLHLHDWHTGAFFLLRELHPAFAHTKAIRCVFTIHNLALQGSRPILGSYASVEQWFPELFNDPSWIAQWKDPRWKDPVFTPMAAGIRFADKVNTVSPTYAEEILLPSDPRNGLIRGEGLEKYLQKAKQDGRLFGIINGAEYPADRKIPKKSFPEILEIILSETKRWKQKKNDPIHDEAARRVERIRALPAPRFILTSVTRVTDQKVKLFFEKGSGKVIAIDEILKDLAANNGVYLFLGTGTADYEELLTRTFQTYERFVYLKGYSDPLAQALYASGTIFMMPSSFEPCGIGQMVAMRDGQPCVVNAVGGLKDTVIDNVNGFVFSGKTIAEQADGLIRTTGRAIDCFLHQPEVWQRIVDAALKARFTWERSAKQYIELLYA